MRVKNIKALKELTGDNFKWAWYSGVTKRRVLCVYGIRCYINHISQNKYFIINDKN